MSLLVDIHKKCGVFSLDISLETDGGISGLLGASGCGKSMTLLCIAGMITPDHGKIVLNGTTLFDSEHRINQTPQQRRVGYLFQNYALFPNMTASQNIACGLHAEKDKAKKARLMQEILTLLQLNGLEHRRPAQLSGGQQQRVALARILVGNPDLILLDEPFSALDSHLRSQLQIEMKHLLRRFGKDVILVTHSRNEAYRLCGKIALLDHGTLLAHKDTKQLFADPQSRQAALLTGCKNIVSARKVGNFEVEVPDWGVRLATSQPVRDDLCAIGIRAHYFHPKTLQNRFPIHFTDEIEDPFEYILPFRYETQQPDSPDILWRIPKEKKSSSLPDAFGIAPANILLLYQ